MPPVYLARSAWTQHPNVSWTPLGPVAHSVVHHTASEFVTAHAYGTLEYLVDLIDFLRVTEAGEMGRADRLIAVAYHWIIDEHGTIIEGRPIDKQGGATLGHNGDTRAYCLIGDFTHHQPTAAALDALAVQLRADVAAGHLTGPVQPTWGHRDVVATACPGDECYPALPHVRDAVAHGAPIPSPIPRPEDFDVQPTDITGHLVTAHGEWMQQADGGILTISGPFFGSYPGLPAQFHDNPNRHFFGPLEPHPDGSPGYVMWSNDATVDPKTHVVSGRYAFP